MAITVIDNQPIRFRTTSDIEADTCGCNGQCFCQLINKSDATQFQLLSSQLISGGTFDDDDWADYDPISLSTTTTNETALDECDGTITIIATGGSGSYTYSKDGITYQGSNILTDFCAGCFDIYVKDSVGVIATDNICIGTSIDCGLYAGSDANDLIALEANEVKDCYANNFI